MSDPEVPQPEQPADVNDVVDSANAGLAEAEAAAAEVPGVSHDSAQTDADAGSAQSAAEPAAIETPVSDAPASETVAQESAETDAVDADLAAFEEAERAHPGTFTTAPAAAPSASSDTTGDATSEAASAAAPASSAAEPSAASDDHVDSIADSVYLASADADDTATRVVPSEPIADDTATRVVPADSLADETETRVVPAPPAAYGTAASASEPAPEAIIAPLPQPIFVQAPEAPRERNNRGTVAGIGLLATLAFALLYLGTALGLGALAGDVSVDNIGEAALAPLLTWGFWVPVVVFFIGFWLLGAIVNRGRWGLWVVFGIVVGVFAWGGHILGQLFEAPFWLLTASEGSELVGEQLLAPLAIAAFVFGRELTIWFGAWAARSGARKTELNAAAQLEYERTLEAGPTLAR